MKPIIVFFLMATVFISCQENKKENSATLKEFVSSEKDIVQKLNSYCFFKLDDKYSIETDSLVINNWLKEKSLAIIKNNAAENIFSQNGGGPNGSQWNPSTDLYIAILAPSNELYEIPKLVANGELKLNKIYKYSPNIIWYVVKQGLWEREIRAIDSIDIKKMYSLEYLNGIENGEFNPMVDLNYGEILKFEITYKTEELTKFFHATYGE